VLDEMPADVGVNVELKNPGTASIRPGESLPEGARERARERWEPFVESVLAVTAERDNEVLFSSFCEGALTALETVDPAADSAALVAPNCADAGETVARRYGVDAIHPPIEQCDPDAAVDWAQVAAELDASLNCWTVTDWQEARTAVQAGADGLIVDYPGLWRGR
jgi:glycerophosphoryl diester phosphodiesterase